MIITPPQKKINKETNQIDGDFDCFNSEVTHQVKAHQTKTESLKN